MGSTKFSLNAADVVKLLKNAALVAVSAALAYTAQHLSSLNLGPSTALVVPIIALVLDAMIKWVKDNTKE